MKMKVIFSVYKTNHSHYNIKYKMWRLQPHALDIKSTEDRPVYRWCVIMMIIIVVN